MKVKAFKNWLKNINWLLILPFSFLTILFIVIPIIMVIVSAFVIEPGATIQDNFIIINGFLWQKIVVTILVAIAVTVLVTFIGFFFAYFLSQSDSRVFKSLSILLITAPLWLSFLVKIISIKTFFDTINKIPESTYGIIYTIVTLTYLNLPTFILIVFNVLESMPKNLINASKDLGRNTISTLFYVVIPYSWQAILNGVFITFIASFAVTGVTGFVDNSNNSNLIGDILLEHGLNANESQIALATISILSLIIGLIMVCAFLFLYYIPKKIKKYRREKNERNFEKNKKN